MLCSFLCSFVYSHSVNKYILNPIETRGGLIGDCFKEVLGSCQLVRLEDQLNIIGQFKPFALPTPTGLLCIIDISKTYIKDFMSVMKLSETALIWKEIIFPFQIFKDIPFQFSTCYIIITAFPVKMSQSSLDLLRTYLHYGNMKKSGH